MAPSKLNWTQKNIIFTLLWKLQTPFQTLLATNNNNDKIILNIF